ncbi:MAG: hypothetical protein EOP07_09045 [Proteobacteria bacterium]|nr:MAG: hypothetical protein EOP07_09045 [Pseudomonadota bacterium]
MRILLILLLTASCSQSNLQSSVDIKSAAQSAADTSPSSSGDSDIHIKPIDASAPVQQSADTGSEESEQANRPVKVSGAYLYCVPLLNTKTLPNNSYIGCRLNDGNGKKVDPRRLAKTVLYKFESDADDRIKIVLRTSVSNARTYDAFLDLNTSSVLTAAEALNRVQVKVELRGMNDGSADVSVSSPIRAVLQPETASGSNVAWSQSCNNGGCEYRDSNTGLYWSAFQAALSYTAAGAFCKNAGSTWRLASANELYVARANQIASNNSSNEYFRAPDTYTWTSDSGSLVGGQPNTRVVVNPTNPNTQFAVYSETILLSFTCIHE